MRIKPLSIACAALVLCACATTPDAPSAPGAPRPVAVNFIGCSGSVRDPNLPDGGNPTVALIVVGLELGFDLAAYSTCAVERLIHPGSMGSVAGGIYRSGQGTFSLALPAPPPEAHKPGIDIRQPTLLPTESVLIRTTDDGAPATSGAVAFGADVSHETMLEQSATLEQAGLEELQRQAGPATTTPVSHEPTTLDGRPALFAVYSVRPAGTGAQPQPRYLFMYFTRYQHDSAAFVVFWSGECPVCAQGHEADIRKLDPNIGRGVDSFHLDEAALATWDAAVPQPAVDAAAPALPSMAVPDGKAVVYFYREHHFAGGGLDFRITEGETDFGTLTNGTYLHAVVDPGAHDFLMTSEGYLSECPVQIKTGEIRYLEIYVAQSGEPPALDCRENPELLTRTKMEDVKEAAKADAED